MQPSVPATFFAAAARFGDAPALLHEGGAVSYARVAEDARRLAAALPGLGLAGERVGLLLPNLPVFPQLLYGVLAAGGRTLLLNPASSPREVAEHLADAGVDAVLTARPLLDLLPPGARALLVDALPDALVVREGEAEREVPLPAAAGTAPAAGGDAEAAVLFTAAVDGRARGAVLSHANLVANLRSTVEAMRLVPGDRVAAVLPFVHAFGLTVSLNATLAAGATLVPVERFHPLRLLDLLEEAGITVLAGVPAIFLGLLAAAERRGVPRHSLRVTLCGGAPLDPEVARRWEELFGVPLRQGFGLTEAGPVCLFNRLDRPNRPETLGHPFPGVQASVRDGAGGELPPGEIGELCVRGENVFHGYLGEPGRSPRDFHGDWLRTGDLASAEPDGSFRFRGILKPMFTRNGFNVYPRELERVLLSDPRVAAVSACSLPDPLKENEIVLLVRPAPGARLGEEEVRELCRERLAAYKQPARVEIEEGPELQPGD